MRGAGCEMLELAQYGGQGCIQQSPVYKGAHFPCVVVPSGSQHSQRVTWPSHLLATVNGWQWSARLVGSCTGHFPALGPLGALSGTLTSPCLPTELPVAILRPLRDKIAMEKHRGVLECHMSRASAQVRWLKGSVELQSGPKYEMVSDGLYRKLVINDVQPDDEDMYTCDAGNVKTSAHFFVEGTGRAWEALPEGESRPLLLPLPFGRWPSPEWA